VDKLEIRAFSISALRMAIYSNELWDTNVIPITRHRAISHVNNPRADDDDVVLLAAYEGHKVIGYMGILADRIHIDNTEHKVGWLSTWWVDSAQRGRGLGRKLFSEALRHYDRYIAVSSFTASAKRVYDASEQFVTLKTLEGGVFIVRLDSNSRLPKRIPKLRFLRPALKLLDTAVNAFANLRLKVWRLRNSRIYGDVEVEYINRIDEQTRQFIADRQKDELSRRNQEELNWVLMYPWVLSAPLGDRTSSRYRFSSVSEKFQYLLVKVFNSDDEMVAFIVLQVRDNVVKTPYFYYNDKYLKHAVYIIGCHIIELNAAVLLTCNSDIATNLWSGGFPCLHKRKMNRESIISRKFEGVDFGKYQLQDGDGDCAFT